MLNKKTISDTAGRNQCELVTLFVSPAIIAYPRARPGGELLLAVRRLRAKRAAVLQRQRRRPQQRHSKTIQEQSQKQPHQQQLCVCVRVVCFDCATVVV